VHDLAQAGDVVLVMGAGSVGQVAPALGTYDSTDALTPGGSASPPGASHAE